MKIPVFSDNKLFYGLAFGAVFIVYAIGSLLDVMDIDAAQYAAISREMLATGNFLQVYEHGKDYLDKPPLLFWFSALSFYLFGVSNVAYRIFPILFTFLGAYSTYKLGKLYYGERVGKMSAFLLVSCQAFFLIHHDVRTDTMVTDSIIFAIWQIALFEEKKRFSNLILGFVGVGLAMLAKGPIGLMVPVLAFITHFIAKRNWSSFFRWQWLVGLVVVALMLAPMCYGLYQQFDMHPEKVVNGGTNKSGLYFYFWSQSFGRLTGQNDFINTSSEPEIQDPFFFWHTFAWSFLPWALLFFPAFLKKVPTIEGVGKEFLTLGGIVFPFIALSFSKYKLPHYIYVFFPLVAIVIARYVIWILEKENTQNKLFFKWSAGFQTFTCLVLWVLAFLLGGYCFPIPSQSWWIWAVIGLALATTVHFFFKAQNRFEQLILPSFFTILGVNFLLNAHIYPTLLAYQSGSHIGRYAREIGIDAKRFYAYTDGYHQSLDFYYRGYLQNLRDLAELAHIAEAGKCWLYTTEENLPALKQQKGISLKLLKQTPLFHITTLTPEFLNPRTRASVVRQMYLYEVEKSF